MAVVSSWFHNKPGKSAGISRKNYIESVEAVAAYNKHTSIERKARIPFIDSQTGVAQNPSNLWHGSGQRESGSYYTQVYCYPAKRWRKKKSIFASSDSHNGKPHPLSMDPDLHALNPMENPILNTIQSMDGNFKVKGRRSRLEGQDLHALNPMENPILNTVQSMDGMVAGDDGSRGSWYDDVMVPHAEDEHGEVENSDVSDFEDAYVKKRKKKKKPGPQRGKRLKNANYDEIADPDKPYSCDLCGTRYKTRPGLSYHLTHAHNSSEDEEVAPPPPPPVMPSSPKGPSQVRNGSSVESNSSTEDNTCKNSRKEHNRQAQEDGGVSNYCDFCLGDEEENKKTGTREELVSCSDCGRSGHPSCLQFNANMIISVKKYPWQCIECKSCGICGTSDNDDQLLFCDDCDRSYHMYCLKPPLAEAPEGSWSCHLCIMEFYEGKKPAGML